VTVITYLLEDWSVDDLTKRQCSERLRLRRSCSIVISVVTSRPRKETKPFLATPIPKSSAAPKSRRSPKCPDANNRCFLRDRPFFCPNCRDRRPDYATYGKAESSLTVADLHGHNKYICIPRTKYVGLSKPTPKMGSYVVHQRGRSGRIIEDFVAQCCGMNRDRILRKNGES
jgi:hypothetical protein